MKAICADIAKYKGRYDAGFDDLRAQRLKRQAELGLIAPDTIPHVPALKQGGWDSLTAAQKREASRNMEIYAAMVDRMDQNIGKVVAELKRTGEYDNTVIIFLADNGAEGMDIAPTLLDLAHIPQPDGTFQGRSVTPIRGKSWVPYLTGGANRVYASDDAIGTELFGSRALRQADRKITDLGDGTWRLFNIAQDPGETRDLSLEQPERVQAMTTAWTTYAKDVGVILPNARLYKP